MARFHLMLVSVIVTAWFAAVGRGDQLVYYSVMLNDRLIGYSTVEAEAAKHDTEEVTRLRSETSLKIALLGKPQKGHDYLYWDYGHVRKTYKQAVRMGDWKGVRNGAKSPVELYSLASDLSETKNVASKHPQIVSQIEDIMKTAPSDSEDYPIGGT